MVTLDDVAATALALPDVLEVDRRGLRTWMISGKTFAWERRFSKADIKRFGDATPPQGDMLAVRTADLGEKEAVLASGLEGVFTIPHFDGFSAVLVELRSASTDAVDELLVDGWLGCAPAALARAYVDRLGGLRDPGGSGEPPGIWP